MIIVPTYYYVISSIFICAVFIRTCMMFREVMKMYFFDSKEMLENQKVPLTKVEEIKNHHFMINKKLSKFPLRSIEIEHVSPTLIVKSSFGEEFTYPKFSLSKLPQENVVRQENKINRLGY